MCLFYANWRVASDQGNTDGTKNGEVIQFIPLKLEINKYMEKIDIVVTDPNIVYKMPERILEYCIYIKN